MRLRCAKLKLLDPGARGLCKRSALPAEIESSISSAPAILRAVNFDTCMVFDSEHRSVPALVLSLNMVGKGGLQACKESGNSLR